jgi:general secretion pathway protein A
MTTHLLALHGLKFFPFRADVPTEALYVTSQVESFVRRVERGAADGGFAMISGDSGTGKTIASRILHHALSALPQVVVATIEHPQSRTSDFYRELGDLYGISLSNHNRWGGFKALRTRWSEHIASTLTRPVLILDEAQEAVTPVLTELRILSSKSFDSKQLLTVVFVGDSRLPERFRTPELLPLGSRVRRRLPLDYASREDLLACLDHVLTVAGNPTLLTDELKSTVADHAAGNYRVMMNLCEELLLAAVDRSLPRLDEKLFLEIFGQPAKPKPTTRKR